MSLPEIASRDEWLATRKELLLGEKELTRLNDALNADRRRLPMVRIEKEYVFAGPAGEIGLLEMFEGRRQLVVQHFMFDPSWDDHDFHVTVDESVAPLLINYRTSAELNPGTAGAEQPMELPGISCFLRDGDSVFHTNSTYARGTEFLAGAYTFLDLTALGRQEDWEEPKGRAAEVHGTDPNFST